MERFPVQICAIGRRMYERGLVVATDGNISARRGDGTIWITPSGACKGQLRPRNLIRIDPSGRVLEGTGRPSSETAMHLAAYEERPDVRAVIHAHPTAAIACSLAGVDLEADLLPEVVIGLDRIAMVPYATPTTEDAARAIRRLVPDHDALVLTRHGSLTVGADLESAYRALERMEHAARVIALGHRLGEPAPLTDAEAARLRAIRHEYLGSVSSAASGTGRPASETEPGFSSPFPRSDVPWD